MSDRFTSEVQHDDEEMKLLIEKRDEDYSPDRAKVLGTVSLAVSFSLGGLGAVYLTRFFAGWPAQIAAGAFMWVPLSVLLLFPIVLAFDALDKWSDDDE